MAESSVEGHDGCTQEIIALKDFGTYVIEPFLPARDGQEAYPQVQELLAFVRESVRRVTHECVPYTDLARAFLGLNLLYGSYTLIAHGEIPEIEAAHRPESGRIFYPAPFGVTKWCGICLDKSSAMW